MCSSDHSKPIIVRFSKVRGLWRRDKDGTVLEEQWLKDKGYEYTIIGDKGYYIDYV